MSAGGAWVQRGGSSAPKLAVRPRRLVVASLASIVVGVTSFAVSVSPAAADYGPGYFSANLSGQASIFSDPHSQLGNGDELEWPAFAGVSGYPDRIDVNVTPPGGDTWHFDFGAPEGQTLHTGVYDDAFGSPVASTPMFTASQGGLGCSGDGRFEIKDLAYDANGTPTRLWVFYELHCSDRPAVFGELRLGEPVDDPSLQSNPSIVRWPVDDFGTVETPVPVLFTTSQATTIDTVALGGSDPKDFRIIWDDCTGLDLSAGGSCTVWVNFDPLDPGLRTATLQVAGSDGPSHAVPLQGFTYGGTTRLVVNGDLQDDCLDGKGYTFSPAGGVVWAMGTSRRVQFATADATDTFEGTFEAPPGQSLTTGASWTGITDDTSNGGGPSVHLGYDSWGCATSSGTLQIVSATYDSYGQLTSFDAKFDLHCENATGGVRGEFKWRAGDDVAPAPWMESDATGGPPGNSGPGATQPNGTTGPGDVTASGPLTVTPVNSAAAATPQTAPSQATSSPQRMSTSHAKSPSRLESFAAVLSRDSRRVSQAVHLIGGRATRSSVLRARRSIDTLRAALTSTQQRLHALAASHRADVLQTMQRLAAWQVTMAAERRSLSLRGPRIATALPPLVSRANRQAAAAIKALGRLNGHQLS